MIRVEKGRRLYVCFRVTLGSMLRLNAEKAYMNGVQLEDSHNN